MLWLSLANNGQKNKIHIQSYKNYFSIQCQSFHSTALKHFHYKFSVWDWSEPVVLSHINQHTKVTHDSKATRCYLDNNFNLLLLYLFSGFLEVIKYFVSAINEASIQPLAIWCVLFTIGFFDNNDKLVIVNIISVIVIVCLDSEHLCLLIALVRQTDNLKTLCLSLRCTKCIFLMDILSIPYIAQNI